MDHKFKFSEGQEIEIRESFWSGKISVYLGGNEITPINKKERTYEIQFGNSKRMFQIQTAGFAKMTEFKLITNGKEFYIPRKLFWYEYILVVIPLLLVFLGGALGALCGGFGTMVNLRMARTEYSNSVKVMLMLSVAVLSLVAYMILALCFLSLMSMLSPKTTSCDNIVELSQKDACYSDLAISNGDHTLCSKVTSLGNRTYCYEVIAIIRLDPSICDNIDTVYRYACYAGVATKKQDPSLCDKIPVKEIMYSCIAGATRDPSVCDKIEDSNFKESCQLTLEKIRGLGG